MGAGYPALDVSEVRYYNGNNTVQITTDNLLEYGAFGNVIRSHSNNNMSYTDDDVISHISYHPDQNNKNLLSIPAEIRVTNASGNLLRKRTSNIDYNTGLMTQMHLFNDNISVDYDMEYDNYGNLTKKTLPPNANGQQMYYQYTYDPVVHTYPITVTDALNYTSSTTYDYAWGLPLSGTDINGQTIYYTYDLRGRLIKVKGPKDPDYTMKFYYSIDDARWSYGHNDNFFKAKTETYDPAHPSDPIIAIAFTDAYRRHQIKQESVVNGTTVMTVSGRATMDNLGRVTAQYNPITEAIGSQNYLYNSNFAPEQPTLNTYDRLDRQLSVTLPDNTVSSLSYDFGFDAFGKKQFRTVATDALGNAVTTYTDARGLKTQNIAPLGAITKFTYTTLGEMESSIDPEGLVTSYEYNMLGRCVARYHPDAGEEKYNFDIAGNMTVSYTQNLINSGQSINYQYNYNQLTDIIYPEHPENNVHYQYGEAGNSIHQQAKAVGRLYMLEDAASYQKFAYDELGNVKENFRTFALPNELRTYTFKMQYEYDSWGRTKNITYPDGEVVSYVYNSAGTLVKMSGMKGNEISNYIDDIRYNKFGQKTEIRYGNGTRETYTYDNLQRLQYLNSYTASNQPMQSLSYSYDAVSNITGIANSAVALSNGLGGSYGNNYQYDELYRLIHAEGNHSAYSLSMTYLPDGKIKQKQLTGQTSLAGVSGTINYTNDYNYHDGTHRLKDINNGQQRFEWDGNGNLLMHENRSFGKRYHCWDEENRLMAFTDNKRFGYYIYDAGGERVYKLSGTVEQTNINGDWTVIGGLVTTGTHTFLTPDASTLYASPYLTATPKGYAKHYYAGNDRIASKLGGGGLIGLDMPCSEDWPNKMEHWQEHYNKLWEHCFYNTASPAKNKEVLLRSLYDYMSVQQPENHRYFYHSDHLGSSAWISNTQGQAIQHLQYLPFGEPRIDQRTTGWNTMYSFSGKERDEESNYSYFGARYYNSDISLWLSVDPRASSYPSLTPYAYCANSPVMYRDPNGEDLALGAVIGGMVGFYQGLQIAIEQGKTGWEKFGYGLLGGLIGSTAGLIGGYVGTSIGAALGTNSFVGGFATAATSSTVSSTISSTGMSWMSGNSFGRGLATGLIQGQISGSISGLMGGLAGGIGAAKHGGNFWTGEGAICEMYVSNSPESPITIGEDMEYSTAYAQKFANTYFRGNDANGVEKLFADGTVPNSNYTVDKAGHVFENGEETKGSTAYLGVGRGSNVYLYKVAFVSKEELYFVMGHEYIHAHFNHIGLLHHDNQHGAIFSWSYHQSKAWSYDVKYYQDIYNSFKNDLYKIPHYLNQSPFSILSATPW